MAIIPYINFLGTTREAISFYEKAIDATDVKIMSMKDLMAMSGGDMGDMQMPESELNLVANASIRVAGDLIMLSDVPGQMSKDFVQGNNITMTITLQDQEKAKKYFEQLSEGGTTIMPLGKAPWAILYGFVIDKFGIGWQINVSDENYV